MAPVRYGIGTDRICVFEIGSQLADQLVSELRVIVTCTRFAAAVGSKRRVGTIVYVCKRIVPTARLAQPERKFENLSILVP